jgi:nitric oxide dioxygenase
MLSVLNTLAAASSARPVLFAHAARAPRHHVQRDGLSRAQQRLPRLRLHVWYEQDATELDAANVSSGRMALTHEIIAAYRNADYYLCGPLPFMREQWRSLIRLGISPARLHREVFGPELLDHLL